VPDPDGRTLHAVTSLWAATPLEERLAFVARLRKRIIRSERELCDAVRADVGKERFECLTGDIAPLLASCRWIERNAARVLGNKSLSSPPFWLRGVRVRVSREPLGRVAIIATWNYPLQLLGIQLAEALACGNTIVVKPSERSPQSQRLLLEIAAACGLPDGTLTWTDATRDDGSRLLAGERFDHVIFTGSTDVGRTIAHRLAGSLTPCTLELSGRDSAIVLDDADPALAAGSIWAAVCMNAGQSCIAPRRALVHASIYDSFVRQLTLLAKKAQPRPLIDAAAALSCAAQVREAIEMGGFDAAGPSPGSPSPAGIYPPPVGASMRPTAVIDCPRTSLLAEGRHFGPALAVLKVESVEQALEIHRESGQHLATSIFTTSTRRAVRLARVVGATSVTVNDCILPTAHPQASIGGRRDSGVGLSRGEEGLLAMTRPMYLSVSKGLARRSLSVPPPFVVNLLARSLRWVYG